MIKRIRFVPSDLSVVKNVEPPVPAKSSVPDWYKAGEMFISKTTHKVAKSTDDDISGGLKSCIPFLDAMISGYYICSWESYYVSTTDVVQDFYPVEKNPYTDKYERSNHRFVPMIDERDGDIGNTIPRPAGHCKNHMVLKGQWGVRLPKNWSLLLTHPFNRFELPFTTTSGIIDSDEWWTAGNVPFFFRQDFEGVIPAGTPFAQIVPIKRSSWISSVSERSKTRNDYMAEKARSIQVGWYKKNMWVKKKYD